MKFVHMLCAIICVTSAAPIVDDEESPRLRVLEKEVDPRDKRSHYGNLYASPCAAATSSSLEKTITPPAVKLVPMQQYMRPYSYNYNYHRYRSIDPNENELFPFSDMNQIPMENLPVGMEALSSYYPGESRMAGLNAKYLAQTMQSYGVFPYTNPSALNVPLLFICSPSIVQGQMVQPQPQYYSGAPDIYKDIDLQSLEPQDHVQTRPEYSPIPQKSSNSDIKA